MTDLAAASAAEAGPSHTSPRSGTRVRAVPVVIALFVLVHWSYRAQVFVVYEYEGYRFRPSELLWIVSSTVLAVVPVAWLPPRPSRPSQVMLWMLHLFVVVPTCAIATSIPGRSQQTMFLWASWSVAFLAIASLVLLPTPPRLPPSPLSARRARLSFLLAAVVLFVVLIVALGTPTQLVSLSGIYTQRLAFRATLATANPAFGYLVGWMQAVVAMLILGSAVARRSVLLAGFGVAVLVWAYAVTGSRQALVAVPFGLLLYFAAGRRVTGAGYALGASVLMATSAGVYALTRRAVGLGAVAERLFAVPGLLGSF
jgi:hypothetical protein